MILLSQEQVSWIYELSLLSAGSKQKTKSVGCSVTLVLWRDEEMLGQVEKWKVETET